MFAAFQRRALQGSFGYSFRELAVRGVNWGHAIKMLAIHAGTIAALWFFTWQALLLAIVLGVAFGMLGITIGYHRLIAHSSFKTHWIIRNMLALFAQLALNGPAAWWYMTHRLHHRHTDTDLDPHTPVKSFAWGHFWCWFQHRDPVTESDLIRKNASGLLKSRFMRFQFYFEPFVLPVQLVVLFAAGWLWDGSYTAWSVMLWGGCARMTIGNHFNWFVNSVAHSHNEEGKPYAELVQPSNLSRNVLLVALTTFGEGFHRNHHAKPRQVHHGEGRQIKYDLSYWVIVGMEKVGLAWDLQRNVRAHAGDHHKPIAA